MKKTIIESIDNDTTAVPSFRGAKFRSLIESILNDSDDSVEGFDELPQEADDDSFETDDVEDADVEDTDDVDVEDADVEDDVDDVDAEADAGSVTIEFTADEISLLRSILDKVDAASDDDTDVDVEDDIEDDVEDDDFDDEDDFDAEGDDDVEDDDADFDDDEETEEEEEDFFDEDEEYVAEENESTTAPRRVQKTPAVNRAGKATAPVIDSAVAAGKAGEAADTKGAPKRTKFNGEIKRGKTKHEGDRYTEGEAMIKIGK